MSNLNSGRSSYDIERSNRVFARNLDGLTEVLEELQNIKEKGPISRLPEYDDITNIIDTYNILNEPDDIGDVEVVDIYDEHQKKQYDKKKVQIQSKAKPVGKYRMPATIAACFAATVVISVATVLAKSQSSELVGLSDGDTSKTFTVDSKTKDVNSTVTTTKDNIKSMVSVAENKTTSNDNSMASKTESKDTVETNKTTSNDSSMTSKIESTGPDQYPSLFLCDKLKLMNVTLTDDHINPTRVIKTKDLKYDCYKIKEASIRRDREQLAEIEVTADKSLITIEKFIDECKNLYGSDIDIKFGVAGMRKDKIVKENVGWLSLNDMKTPRKSEKNKKLSKKKRLKASTK